MKLSWLEWIYSKTRENCETNGFSIPEYKDFKQKGWYRPEPPEKPNVMLEAFRRKPQANPLNTPSGKIEIYSSLLNAFKLDDCAGHASWFEPAEWLGNAKDFPLHLISNQPASKLHSQLDHGSVSRATKIQQREPIMLNSLDAEVRRLKADDVVRVFNKRGACLAAVIIDDQVMPGVVQMSTGAWYDPLEPGEIGSLCKHGNVNVLTLDKGSSKLGQGPTAHTCLVEVELFEGELPAVTAFDPPVVLGG